MEKTIKHEESIMSLFAALQERPVAERPALYDALALIIEDARAHFDQNATNAQYMKGRTGLFLHSCRVIAGLKEPATTLEQSLSHARMQLLVVRSMGQWK